MPQADTEDGQLSPKLTDQFNYRLCILRISRTVGNEQAIRCHFPNLPGSGVPRQYCHITAPCIQAADNIMLHAAVDGGHMKPTVFTGCCPCFWGADPCHLILGKAQCLQSGHRSNIWKSRICKECLAGTFIPNMPGQCTGIHTGDSHNSKLAHHLFQCLSSTEIGGFAIIFPDDYGADGRTVRFVVILAHAVVADQRIGHHHCLSGIAWIRKDLLIANH